MPARTRTTIKTSTVLPATEIESLERIGAVFERLLLAGSDSTPKSYAIQAFAQLLQGKAETSETVIEIKSAESCSVAELPESLNAR